MFTMFAIFASYGTIKATCVTFHIDDCPWRLRFFILSLLILKILCWEVCFPTPPSKYVLKFYPVIFFGFVVITGSIIMAYIATALQNYENLFNILIMTSLTIIVGYAVPVTARKLNSKDWAAILRYTNIFFSTLCMLVLCWIIFIPVIGYSTGSNKTFFLLTLIVVIALMVIQLIEYVVLYFITKKKARSIRDTYTSDAIMVYGSFVYLFTFLIVSHPFYNLRYWQNKES